MRFLWAFIFKCYQALTQLFTKKKYNGEQLRDTYDAEEPTAIPEHWLNDCQRIADEAALHEHVQPAMLKHGPTRPQHHSQHQHSNAPQHWLQDVQRIHQQLPPSQEHVPGTTHQSVAASHTQATAINNAATQAHTQSEQITNATAVHVANTHQAQQHAKHAQNNAATATPAMHMSTMAALHDQNVAHKNTHYHTPDNNNNHQRQQWQATAPAIHALSPQPQETHVRTIPNAADIITARNTTTVTEKPVHQQSISHVETHISYAETNTVDSRQQTPVQHKQFFLKRIIKRFYPSRSKLKAGAPEVATPEINRSQNVTNIPPQTREQHIPKITGVSAPTPPQTTNQVASTPALATLQKTTTQEALHTEQSHNSHAAIPAVVSAGTPNRNTTNKISHVSHAQHAQNKPVPPNNEGFPPLPQSAASLIPNNHVPVSNAVPSNQNKSQTPDALWPQLDEDNAWDEIDELSTTATPADTTGNNASWRQTWSV